MGDLQIKPKHLKSDTERVQDFQRKLYRKAKQESDFRFYVLYDKVRLPHFIKEAYKRCKAKNGKPGIDGISFKDIDTYGVNKFMTDIIEDLENRMYKPQGVLRVEIPKANGKTRPLGIPTVRDRVIQMAVKLVIEPIFEADFEDNSYGFRPRRGASDVVKKIKENLKQEKCDIFDADLNAYFDTIPHKELMHLLAIRISDKNILHLIKMWLKAPVIKEGKPTGGKKSKIGIPQECYDYLNHMLDRMKLKLNMEKSKTISAYKNPLDFLVHTFRYSDDYFGRPFKYWNVEPSKKSQKKVRSKIREYIRKNGHKAPDLVAKDLNAITRGWINYFTIKGVTYPAVAKRNLRYYLTVKLTRFYQRKSQRKCKLHNQGAFEVLVNKHGLIDPTKYALS